MSLQAVSSDQLPRNLWRSVAAVCLGLIAVALPTIGTDELLHAVHVYPPHGQPMHDPALLILAAGYRFAYAIFGSYVAARLAPRYPMRHAMVLGVIGLVASTAAAIATMPLKLAPAWFPIVLVISALPCAWLGGVLYRRRHARPDSAQNKG